jgi:leucyl-tRNA synthetase
LAYLRTTASSITSTEAAFAKRLSKGKNVGFDPRKPKKLTIFVAKKFPSWQEKYIDLVREAFDSISLSINDKELNPKVAKLGEMKKAMPFVQGLKRRLTQAKESPDTVFNRELAFDESQTLRDCIPSLKRTTGCKDVEVVIVDEGGKAGTTLEGERREGLPPQAEASVPGQPTFHFENTAQVDGSA